MKKSGAALPLSKLFYCRQTAYNNDNVRIRSCIAPERLQTLANSLHYRIQNHIPVTFNDIHQEIIQQHNEQRLIAVTRATQLNFQGQQRNSEEKFRIQHIMYTEQIFEGYRNRSVFNMNETTPKYQTRCSTSNDMGLKRVISAPKENLVGHISLALTISPEFRQPPRFVTLGNLIKVPLYILHEFTNDEVIVDVSSSGFMTQDVFRRWVRQFFKWVREQKAAKYFEQKEKIILILDSHKSRGDDTALELLKEEGITCVVLPVALTHILQPLYSILFRQFRNAYNRLFEIQISI
ncbi:MAG: hypothetical protein EZS28_004592 [Streblomastix strix]|uniref:DDE-1 domain-containing protein n=1 Tax=Streblomastix strix TaxID=222440 RepID=A0A5J4WYC2_9EUKA|nr:MAG: hypothetical protein EZS28_004592 [Streblomastix strix]